MEKSDLPEKEFVERVTHLEQAVSGLHNRLSDLEKHNSLIKKEEKEAKEYFEVCHKLYLFDAYT